MRLTRLDLYTLGNNLHKGFIMDTEFGEQAKLIKCLEESGVPFGLEYPEGVNVVKEKWLVEIIPADNFGKPFKTHRKFLKYHSFGLLDCSTRENKN